ncbi:tRNA (adenosine(37)-N6)-threonylcarbamoyltransferase complex ATPase subunit type 1 TsaE [Corynebacterium sp. 13CS0277]|uniref:tRNA (adenosine(37)-N6)-threonylcarbamoyltransferase complex ATPase subunit type 1 TsaE n=1 Tax=Corynebacterium sp. 13CS0277 TaxID=2071994 RepID=UPI001E482D9C|nr:tRNA (adenosine(37)-N6)-threonylcarbamoyltransferase complex ATPase subunit type 1 TsaE [Corynebacterium sp. 13CS0277]
MRQQVNKRVCATRADTWALAEEIGAALRPGDVVLLEGPLGAGKTTFTQGLARGLNVKGRVTSPTFVLAREHRAAGDGPNLVHVDAYRLLDGAREGQSVDLAAELDSLDLDSELDDAVVVAEWGGGLVESLASRYLHIVIDRESAHQGSRGGELDFDEDEARIISWRWRHAPRA